MYAIGIIHPFVVAYGSMWVDSDVGVSSYAMISLARLVTGHFILQGVVVGIRAHSQIMFLEQMFMSKKVFSGNSLVEHGKFSWAFH